MWVYEGFIVYFENFYFDYYYGSEVSVDYVIGICKVIMNDWLVIGDYDVNYVGFLDMYYKGVNMFYIICIFLGDDEKWCSIFWGLNKDFYY